MKDYLKNSIIEDAQQDTIAAANQLIAKIAAANQLIAKLKAEIELLTATIEAAQDSTALELACGTANISNYLVAEGYTVDACDISPQMLSIADKKELKPNLYQAALTDEIPEGDYDLILCFAEVALEERKEQ